MKIKERPIRFTNKMKQHSIKLSNNSAAVHVSVCPSGTIAKASSIAPAQHSNSQCRTIAAAAQAWHCVHWFDQSKQHTTLAETAQKTSQYQAKYQAMKQCTIWIYPSCVYLWSIQSFSTSIVLNNCMSV